MTHQRFHVAFDMDDTLCALVGPSIELARRVIKKNLQIPTYGKYFGWFPGQMTDEERQELLTHVYTPEYYLGLPPNFHVKPTLADVSRIAHKHFASVQIITARGHALGDRALDVTREWLDRNGWIGADTVPIHTPTHAICKTSFCQEPTVMVDDAIHVADAFGANEQHRVILIDQLWNRGHPKSRYSMRVPSRNLCEALINIQGL